MIKQMKNKLCEMCKEVEFELTVHNKKYCVECKKEYQLEHTRKSSKENSIIKKIKMLEELERYFKELNPTGSQLLPREFGSISKYSVLKYVKNYELTWLDVITSFNKLEEFTDVVLKKFEDFCLTTGSSDGDKFCSSIGIKYKTIKHLDFESAKKKAGLKSHKITKEVLSEDFYNVIQRNNGVIPYCSDLFNTLSAYSIYSYAKHFDLINSNYYEQILRMFIDSEKVEDFLVSSEKVVRRNMSEAKKIHTDESLEENFKETIDDYRVKFDEAPNSAMFDVFSAIPLSAYKGRLKTSSYYNILDYYGYKDKMLMSNIESTTIRGVETLLNSYCEKQKTFKWLNSFKDYPLRCDAYFSDYNFVLEVDGSQHFSPVEHWGGEEAFERLLKNDHIKNTLIPQNGITLIRIGYDEPYHDESFLLMRLIENGIFPSGYTEVTHSSQKSA